MHNAHFNQLQKLRFYKGYTHQHSEQTPEYLIWKDIFYPGANHNNFKNYLTLESA